MKNLFLYGTLRHLPLLEKVLGRVPDVVPASLAGAGVFWVAEQPFPMIAEAQGTAQGLLLPVTEEDQARLDFYEAGFVFAVRDVTVETADGPVAAQVYWPGPEWRRGAPWSLADWVARWGALTLAASEDVMAGFGSERPEDLARRMPSIRARAQARLLAKTHEAPTTLRRKAAPGDVVVDEKSTPYKGFFSVEAFKLRHRRFDGSMSQVLDRAAFISADAATVLPYDPAQDCVLIIEQFRMGPFVRGDAQPWSLEAIAGRIDPGESAEEAVRREAREEAGLELEAVHPIARYYPTPGAKAEFLHSFIGIADLPKPSEAGQGGLETEAEDIRWHVLPFEALDPLVASGEIGNAPLILSIQFLAGLRARLRS